ncbi:flagellar basal-body MS-ring/collar protein FliF [Acidimangrovimonas pyrenivorans]|uniref:Flagellar M-ring protein n=1 Tax=Acidimangrovimonas pyrenivorans TaxID=2030798 RepID=A0ABV7APA4_9RHOB
MTEADVKQIVENLLSLGRKRLLILGGVGLGGVFALLFGLSLVTAPTYKPLYNQLSPASAAKVVDALDKAGIQTRVSEDGGSVSVPQQDLAQARMTLAEQGLPADGEPGWELFDNSSGLGMNTFMQHVNRLRAMEGELARSIQTLDGINSARVHLVLPEREAFSRTRPDPSASVVVRADASHTVSRKQALAIRNLVAAAVANLSPGRVTVLSARGDTILAEDSADAGPATIESAKSSIEDRMSRNIQQILSARVGAGNVRVQVAVELDTARQVVVQQSFDPNQQVVRSTESRNEKSQDQNATGGQVGVTANLPPALAGPGGAGGSSNNSAKTNERTTYEIGSTRSETTREAGAIKRVSVAVLVNGIYEKQGGGVKYQERSPEELSRLTKLVESAIGYDKARGDTVSVDSLRFMDYSMDVGEPVGPTLGQRLSDNIMSILRGVLALLVVGVTVIFGFRPVMNRLLDETPALPAKPDAAALAAPEAEAGDPEAEAKAPEGQAPPASLPARPAPPRPAVVRPQAVTSISGGLGEGLFDSGTIHSSMFKRKVETVRGYVQQEPNEAIKILRGWLMNEA